MEEDRIVEAPLVFIYLTPSWHNEMLRRLNRLRYFAQDLNALYHVYDIGSTDFYVLPNELPLQWEGQLIKADQSYGFVSISKQERDALPLAGCKGGKYELVIDKNLKGHYRSVTGQAHLRTVDFNLEQIVDPKIVEKYGYL